MRYQDLSAFSKDLISGFQNKALGSKVAGLLAIATSLAIMAPLEKINTGDEYGVARSIIIKRHLEKTCGNINREILEEFLNFVPFDFKFVQELVGDLYALRYLQAFDTTVFISSTYKLDRYIENNFMSYRMRMGPESSISNEIAKTIVEEGFDISTYANLFTCFIDDVNKAGALKSNALMNATEQ